MVLDGSQRRRSEVTHSPSGGNRVSKKRRDKPLPPIAVDPNDKAAMKRARNTLAARDSRQRKFEHVAKLEGLNAELEAKNAMLEAEVEKWKNIALLHGFKGPA